MAVVETIAFAITTGIAKYLVKEVLPKDWQDQIGAELVKLGIDWVRGKRETDPVAAAIGERIEIIYKQSPLDEERKNVVIAEVIYTLALAQTKPDDLVDLELDAKKLQKALVGKRPEVVKELSRDEEALYEQMLRVASEAIIDVADQMSGFLQAVGGALLRAQRELDNQSIRLLDLQEELRVGWAKWLAQPEEEALKFQELYCDFLGDSLDTLEPFGIPLRDELGQTLKLQDAFVNLKLKRRESRFGGEFFPFNIKSEIKLGIGWEEGLRDELTQLGDRVRQHKSEGSSEWLEQRKELLITHEESWNKLFEPYASDLEAADGETIEDVLARCLVSSPVSGEVAYDQALADERRVMIDGYAGSGKSTLLQWLAVQAAQASFPKSMASWNGLIPFFIRLRRCGRDGFPAPEDWPRLEVKSLRGTMPRGWVHEQLESGRALVLIDGVDEMPKKQRADLLRELKGIVRTFPLARYVVTSRPPSVNEQQWPEWRNWLKDAGFVETVLKDMDSEQLPVFVEQWHSALEKVRISEEAKEKARQNAGKMTQLLDRREELRKLATTPLLAAMICTLYQERGDYIPQARLKLYEECVEMLLERREQKKEVDLREEYVQLDYEKKFALLQKLAYWMLDNEYSAVPVDVAEARFAEHIPSLGLTEEISAHEVRRLFVERIGLLEEAILDEISFRHRTFQEYLAAKAALQYENIGVLAKHNTNDQWREVIILGAGLADEKDKRTLLRSLISRAIRIKTTRIRHERLLLPLACLETVTELDPGLREEVMTAVRPVFPPHSIDEAVQVSKAGIGAIDFLGYDADYPEEVAGYCLKALANIGGERAMAAVAKYTADDRYAVHRAIGDIWPEFDAKSYAEKILGNCDRLVFSNQACLNMAPDFWPQLTTLTLSGIGNLSPLAALSNLTSLDLRLSGEQVGDLSSLAALSNLTSLDLSLSGEQVGDLSSLAALSNLTSFDLRLFGEQVGGLSSLAALSNLTSLDLWLSGKQVGDLSSLAALSNLTSFDLRLFGEQVGDLSPLAALSNLTSLDLSLSGEQVGDLSSLAALSNLTSLNLRLSGEQVGDLSSLAALSNLTSLDLWLSGKQQVGDLSPLAALSNLTSLDLWLSGKQQVGDLSSLAALSNLTSFDLRLFGKQVGDLSPLAALSNLTSLDLSLSGEQVGDLSSLAALSNLTSLNLSLSGEQVGDLSPLAALSNLTSLDLSLSGEQVGDLSSLAALSNLTSLNLSLSGEQVGDLSSLAALSNLTSLNLSLSGEQVGDLSSLAALSNLTSLDLRLSGEQVGDLSSLAALSNLTSLTLSGRRLGDLSSLAALSNLTELDVNYTEATDLAALKQLAGLSRLIVTQSQMDRLSSELETMERRSGMTILVLEERQPGLLQHFEFLAQSMGTKRFFARNC